MINNVREDVIVSLMMYIGHLVKDLGPTYSREVGTLAHVIIFDCETPHHTKSLTNEEETGNKVSLVADPDRREGLVQNMNFL